MAKPYVTLILGAGASYPYKFPLGSDIIDILIVEARKFIQLLHSPTISQEERCLWSKNISNSEGVNAYRVKLREAASGLEDQLKLYRPQSIDRFLGHLYSDNNNPDLVNVARLLISKAIVRSYNEGPIAYSENKNRWMEYLFNALFYCVHQKQYELDDLPIKIITFNYDISLEIYFNSLTNAGRFSSPDKRAKVRTLFNDSIVHVYGQLGFMQWQRNSKINKDVENEIIDDGDLSSADFKEKLACNSYKRIRMIPQLQDCGDPFRYCNQSVELAKTWIENSKTVIISGYAFDQVNNDILALDKTLKSVSKIYATLYDTGHSTHQTVSDICWLRQGRNNDMLRAVYLDSKLISSEAAGRKSPAHIFTNTTTRDLFKKEVDLVREVLE